MIFETQTMQVHRYLWVPLFLVLCCGVSATAQTADGELRISVRDTDGLGAVRGFHVYLSVYTASLSVIQVLKSEPGSSKYVLPFRRRQPSLSMLPESLLRFSSPAMPLCSTPRSRPQ
jgi:hypothetical protein